MGKQQLSTLNERGQNYFWKVEFVELKHEQSNKQKKVPFMSK